jgi:hypothetical protein
MINLLKQENMNTEVKEKMMGFLEKREEALLEEKRKFRRKDVAA